MRTIKQLSLALMLAAIVGTGCKKDDNQSSTGNADKQLQSKTTRQLLAFRDNLQLKNGESMSMDSATWYLEGLLNLENANNNHQFDGLEFFTDTLVMFTSGSEISINELNDAYTYFKTKLAEIAQSQTIPDFAFDALDITFINTGLKSGEIKAAISISAGSNTVGNYSAFGSTDYWVWGMQGGKCDAYAGQGGTSDAAQQLNYKFNHPIALPAPGYYTDVESKYADGSEFPDANNPGPYCDYKIFFFDAGNTGIWPCLAPNELNYYLSTMPYIIEAKRPDFKSYINVSVEAIFILNGTNYYWHSYKLNFGYFHEYDYTL